MNYTQVVCSALFSVLLIHSDMTLLAVVSLKRGSDQSTHAHIGLQLQPPPCLILSTGKYASATSSFSLPISTSCSTGWSEVRCFEWRLLQEAFFSDCYTSKL